MRVPNGFLDSVFFVCTENNKGEYIPGATGFFVAVQLEGFSFTYAVTARHVVEDPKSDTLHIRMNKMSDGTVDVPTSRFAWETHKAADVAVLRIDREALGMEGRPITAVPVEQFVDSDHRFRGFPYDEPFQVMRGLEMVAETDGMDLGVGDELFSADCSRSIPAKMR